jgi:hypothetical protein
MKKLIFNILVILVCATGLAYSDDENLLKLKLLKISKDSLVFEVSCKSPNPVFIANPEKCGATLEMDSGGVSGVVSSDNDSPYHWKHVIILSGSREDSLDVERDTIKLSFSKIGSKIDFGKASNFVLCLMVSDSKSFSKDSIASFKIKRIPVSIEGVIKE